MNALQLRCSEKGLKSQSLKRIAEELSNRLGYKVIRTTHDGAPGSLQLKWGAASNKLHQYEWFKGKGLSSLEYTTDQAKAGAWFNAGGAVVGRKLLESYEGKGIVMFDPEKGSPTKEDVLACKVFTKFIPKDREFRVHMFKGKPVVILEKKKKKDWEGPKSKYIFNTEHGYVFCQNDLKIGPSLESMINALATQSSGVNSSDFQGVDIGYCSETGKLFVIEVNSAPGIEGSNVARYCDVIQAYLKPKTPATTWPL
jgi:hypothetical protein